MKIKSTRPNQGFTLIEVIVSFVLIGIIGSMMISFFNNAVSESGRVPAWLDTSANLHKVMENITAAYNGYPRWNQSTIYTVGSIVTPTVKNGHFYRCTTAGTSGAVEPSNWCPSVGSCFTEGATTVTVIDGTVIWTEYTVTLLNSIKTDVGMAGGPVGATYLTGVIGTFTVLENKFIKYDPTTRTAQDAGPSDPKTILKITVKSSEGQVLTSIYGSDV